MPITADSLRLPAMRTVLFLYLYFILLLGLFYKIFLYANYFPYVLGIYS